MVIGVSVITCCLVYSVMLLILYFSKRRIDNMENKIYSILVVINVFGLLLELACCYFTYNNGTTTFNTLMCIICNRFFIIYMLTWLFIFTFYIFYITFSQHHKIKKELDKYKRRFIIVAGIIYLILFVLALTLPLEYFNDGNYVYSYGPATSLLVIFGGFSIIFDIFCVIKNRKNIRNKQYYPLFVLIVLMIIVLIIRNVNPGIILINSTFAFITALMFHTIENPDAQLIGELYKNKKLIEKSNEDTSKFLFRITQDIKNPVRQIVTISREMLESKDVESLKHDSKIINNYSNQIDYIINSALNISSMDTQKIKIFENKYNVGNLFKELSYRIKADINPEIKYNFTMSNTIPDFLYGDTIKLKQAISSLLMNSVQNTTAGFINLDVSAIIKYNICRLIINIEDSGVGMDVDKVNDILSTNPENLKEIDINKLNEKELDFKAIKKIINMLGGSLMVKSEINQGTTFTVVLDQKVVETEETELSKKLESYEQTIYGNKKVLIVDDDDKELREIVKQLEGEDIVVSSSIFGRDCIEKARAKVKYDLIILDDEMPNYSALAILQELQKIKGFKTPVVVMINDNKEGIKLHYLKDGFADCIMKSKLDSEIKRIMKRF